MSYVPPHQRNRKEKKVEMPKIVESEFPEFGSGPRLSAFKRPSFISKVKEETKTINIPERDTPAVVPRRHHFTFGNRETEAKDEDEEDEYEPEPQLALKTEDDGWQTVERKIRVKKDKIQEALDNEDGEVDEEESAWDEQPEEYETYWDERKH